VSTRSKTGLKVLAPIQIRCKREYVLLLPLLFEVCLAQWLVCSTYMRVGRVRTPNTIFILQTRKIMKKSGKIRGNRGKSGKNEKKN